MSQSNSKPLAGPVKDPTDEEEEDADFKAGTEITSSKTTYTIIQLLGEGGFGAVYLVKDKKGVKSAMKIERKSEKRVHSKLKMEIAILKLVSDSKHFTRILDRGKKDKEAFFFLVMKLVGKNLADLKAECKQKVFSFATGIGVAKQCLEAVEELHKHGFIHRDLKPQNFACGLDSDKHTIYILDFGISRKFVNEKNEVKTPRDGIPFKGTIRFASLACHMYQEMGPKDDCESWFYLTIDLILVGGLPWRKLTDRREVMKNKEECQGNIKGPLFSGIKHNAELYKILEYFRQLAYQDKVDYKFVYKMLNEAAHSAGVSIDGPYDWELNTVEKTAEQKTAEQKTAIA